MSKFYEILNDLPDEYREVLLTRNKAEIMKWLAGEFKPELSGEKYLRLRAKLADEQEIALDAVAFGFGIIQNGKRIAPDQFWADRTDDGDTGEPPSARPLSQD